MPKISAYILTFNEEDKIENALESITWADEIVIADSFSTDRTLEIARRYTQRIEQIPFGGFGKLRNEAVARCTHDWIFSLDADERCTPEARDEILETVARPDAADAYLVPRRNRFLGRSIRHGGWYPDYRQPQLFRKGRLRYLEDPVHERYEVTGTLGRLQSPIRQIPYKDLAQSIAKWQRYSTLGAERLELRGVRGSMGKGLAHGLVSFLKIYVLRLGFLDGWAGFVIAFGNFEGTFYRYAKRYEEMNAWSPPASPPLRRRDDSPAASARPAPTKD